MTRLDDDHRNGLGAIGERPARCGQHGGDIAYPQIVATPFGEGQRQEMGLIPRRLLVRVGGSALQCRVSFLNPAFLTTTCPSG